MWNRLLFLSRRAERVAWLVAVCCFCACTAPPEALRFGLAAAPATLDPRYYTDAAAARIGRLIFEQLVDFDLAFEPVPALADWVLIAPTQYRFTLRRASHFHDGTRLTAQDIAATYRAVLTPTSTSPHRGTLNNIARVEVLAPETIDFYLRRPDPLFPGLLTLGILPARQAASPQVLSSPIGSGPFVLERQTAPEHVQLTRRQDGQRLEFLTITSETTRALKLARGELDILQGGLSPETTRWLARQPEVRVSQRPGTVFSYIGTNLAHGPTSQRKVREALLLALDREAILHYLLNDQGRRAETLLVPEHWAAAKLNGPARDLTAARRALAAAGFGVARPLRLELKTSSDAFRRRLATVLQQQWREAGIEVTLKSYDWGTFYGDVKAGRFDLYLLSWVGLQLPDIFRQAFHSDSRPPRGANRGGYVNAEVDALIDTAERATNLHARIRDYRALQALLLRDLPYLPLWFEDTLIVQRTRVHGYDTDLHADYDGLTRAKLIADDAATH